jgi:hypothetical protein
MAAGLHEKTGQRAPPDLIALPVPTPLDHFLWDLVEKARPNFIMDGFVRVHESANNITNEDINQSLAHFLTVVIRTQGQRIFQLREALLSLGGQSVDDFDILIILHRADGAQAANVRELVASFPESLSGKTKIVECSAEGRAAPLNAAVELPFGRYIAFLDDDDFVFGHWVETFRKLANKQSAKILRARCVRQRVSWRADSPLGSHPSPTSWFETAYPDHYDFLENLHDNHSPFMSLAFPGSAFRDLGLRFDESLTTAEDWDFTTRTVQLCGIANTATITCVYRWWDNMSSSMSLIAKEEWSANRSTIINKLNRKPTLLPSGAVLQIIGLVEQNREAQAYIKHLKEVESRLSMHESQLAWREAQLEQRTIQANQQQKRKSKYKYRFLPRINLKRIRRTLRELFYA